MDDWDYSSIDDNYWSDTGNTPNTNTYEPVEDNYWSNTWNTGWTDNSDYNYSNPSTSYGDWFPQTSATTVQQSPAVENFLSNPSYNYTPITNPLGTSTSSFLQDLFTKGTNSNNIGQLAAALLTGRQNKQQASALNKAASTVDPWASQRPFYQQQAQSAVTDPYSAPIVKAQIEQLQKAQNIKDAAAGRRSNSLLGSTAVLAEEAKIAQAYQAQMANQGGANISPASSASLLGQAATANTNGYITPLVTLFGNQTQNTSNTNYLNALTKFLTAYYAKYTS